MAEEPQVGFVTMGAAATEGDIPSIGIGMLGYAFMGKAHTNALKKIGYITYPPPYPRGSSRSRTQRGGGGRGGQALRLREVDDELGGRRQRSGRPGLRQRRPERRPPRADDRRRQGRQARHLREAARADGGGELRHLEGGGGDGRQAPVRVQLPLLPRDPARQADDRRRRDRRDLPLPGALPPGVDHGSAVPEGLAARQVGRGLGRPRRSRGARDRPVPLPRSASRPRSAGS